VTLQAPVLEKETLEGHMKFEKSPWVGGPKVVGKTRPGPIDPGRTKGVKGIKKGDGGWGVWKVIFRKDEKKGRENKRLGEGEWWGAERTEKKTNRSVWDTTYNRRIFGWITRTSRFFEGVACPSAEEIGRRKRGCQNEFLCRYWGGETQKKPGKRLDEERGKT